MHSSLQIGLALVVSNLSYISLEILEFLYLHKSGMFFSQKKPGDFFQNISVMHCLACCIHFWFWRSWV